MVFLYQFIVLGDPSIEQVAELEEFISQALESFELRIDREVEWLVNPQALKLKQQQATAAVFFGGENLLADDLHLQTLLDRNIPILPVVSDITQVHVEIPPVLRLLNCLSYQAGGFARVATALLECVGLLPRQRRVFLSYRRDESRQAALQLFDELSARLFDVFLDTHGVAPSEDFQATLWHRLCDADVLLMLDTPNYFASRWTSAEFSRALAKGIQILRIGWAGVEPSKLTTTASYINLAADDLDLNTGKLTDRSISEICLQLETVRSRSHAVRNLNLVSNIRSDVEKIGGSVTGVGINKSIHIRLLNGHNLVVYPMVGVPTATTLHNAMKSSPNSSIAVVFDYVGLHRDCLEHLDWLGIHIRSTRLVKVNELAWHFADWEV